MGQDKHPQRAEEPGRSGACSQCPPLPLSTGREVPTDAQLASPSVRQGSSENCLHLTDEDMVTQLVSGEPAPPPSAHRLWVHQTWCPCSSPAPWAWSSFWVAQGPLPRFPRCTEVQASGSRAPSAGLRPPGTRALGLALGYPRPHAPQIERPSLTPCWGAGDKQQRPHSRNSESIRKCAEVGGSN